MIENLSSFFKPEQEYYLESIKYTRLEENREVKEHTLTCTDTLNVVLKPDSIVLTTMRHLYCEPKELFDVTVSFGAILRFNEEKKGEKDWNSINLADEFKENGDFVLTNLYSRASLLIAQITSSYGLQPLILPPRIKKTV